MLFRDLAIEPADLSLVLEISMQMAPAMIRKGSVEQYLAVQCFAAQLVYLGRGWRESGEGYAVRKLRATADI